MGAVWTVAVAAHWTVAAFVVLSILRRRGDPAAMLAWIFAVVTLPGLGVFFYMLLSQVRVRRRLTRRRRRVADLIASVDAEAGRRTRCENDERADRLADDLAVIERIGRRMAEFPAVGGNGVDVYEDANAIYTALEQEINAARHHVHMQYYIWQPDETGRHFRDLVIAAAKRGVRCRVLLDAVGCLRLRGSFVQPMIDAGVHVSFFMPLLRFRRRWSPHLRNHRKIAVMDGVTAFVGSQNIGDEYRGRLKRLSPWYDSHLRIRGPAATMVQQIFAEDWAFTTEQALVGDEYFPLPPRAGESVVQILPSGPDQDVSALGQIIFACAAVAKRSMRIATPYFVPTPQLRQTLIHAAYRGVEVELVVPARSDNTLVVWAGRSYYAELLDAGVRIYEFERGMLHSKMVAVDDRVCLVGSANMDVRSIRLNFEATALVYDEGVARRVSDFIAAHRDESRRVEAREVWNRPIHAELAEGVARLCAPLL